MYAREILLIVLQPQNAYRRNTTAVQVTCTNELIAYEKGCKGIQLEPREIYVL